MLIDDESAATGTQIKLASTYSPANCGSAGTWFDYPAGNITPDPFAFSAQPPGLGSDGGPTGSEAGPTGDGASPVDAGRSDSGIIDSGVALDTGVGETGTGPGDGGSASGPRAACISGTTGVAQYSTSGIGLNFNTMAAPDGGNAIPIPTDASSHTGIQFWAWGGTSGAQSVFVSLPDLNETPNLGPAGTMTATGQLCDGGTNGVGTGPTACGGSRASSSIAPGWQLIKIPFSMFLPINGFGSANESALDPSTLTQFQLQVQQPIADASAGVAFNICIATISFY